MRGGVTFSSLEWRYPRLTSVFRCLKEVSLYYFYAFYAYTYILRTRWTRQSAICARRKNRAQFITGLCHRQPSNKGLLTEAELTLGTISEARPRISLTFHWKRRKHLKNLWTFESETVLFCVVFRLLSLKQGILGLHCHAMKNTNANRSIQKDQNLGNEKR